MREHKLNIPADGECLPGTNVKVPHYFVGAEAFEMTPNLMRPYPGSHLEKEKTICNYRLSRAQRAIENSFGILVARWRFLTSFAGFHPDMFWQPFACTIS